MTVEVFKTNVNQQCHADLLVDLIHRSFSHYKANFDLQDCDRILRVASSAGFVQPSPLISLVKSFGFHAEILVDEPQAIEGVKFVNSAFPSSAGSKIRELLLARFHGEK